jgi:uncharacterized membrane protein
LAFLCPRFREQAGPDPFLQYERGFEIVLWLLVLVLVIAAIAGGVSVSGLLWLLLIAAVVVAIFALLSRGSGRTI